ncbi:proto-oncogene Mas-like, partial [Pseudonaja textilis]|uniref:proto-oncogene Mas-like n=1 Tax=Pseudonaja textilis TaxID=8673 RepID=UPI000EA911DE
YDHRELTQCLIFTYCTGQFLLTIISIDGCLALFFPIWHRCHQPSYLSTTLCAFSWIASPLLSSPHSTTFSHVTSVCVPLMVASSLAPFIKGYLKSQMKRQRKLLKAILLALFFFLICSIPPCVIYLKDVLFKHIIERYGNLITCGYLCPCLNSSVNPLIYFLLGRKKEYNTMCNLKVNLQRLFKEEEESEEQPGVMYS